MKNWQFWGMLAVLMVINGNVCETSSAQIGSGILSYIFGLIAIGSYLYTAWNGPADKS